MKPLPKPSIGKRPPSLDQLGEGWTYGEGNVYLDNHKDSDVVVVVASGLTSHPTYLPVVRDLHDRGLRVIAFPLPGHRGTESIPDITPQKVVDQRVRVLRDLVPGKPLFFVGVSGGAALNYPLAAAMGSQFQGMWSVNPVGSPDPAAETVLTEMVEAGEGAAPAGVVEEPLDQAAQTEALAEIANGGRSFGRATSDFLLAPGRGRGNSWTKAARGAYRVGSYYASGFRQAIEVSRMCASVDATKAMQRLRDQHDVGGRTPVLLFRGEVDLVCSPDIFRYQRRLLQPWFAVEMQQRGHSWLGLYDTNARLSARFIADHIVADAAVVREHGASSPQRAQLWSEAHDRYFALGSAVTARDAAAKALSEPLVGPIIEASITAPPTTVRQGPGAGLRARARTARSSGAWVVGGTRAPGGQQGPQRLRADEAGTALDAVTADPSGGADRQVEVGDAATGSDVTAPGGEGKTPSAPTRPALPARLRARRRGSDPGRGPTLS